MPPGNDSGLRAFDIDAATLPPKDVTRKLKVGSLTAVTSVPLGVVMTQSTGVRIISTALGLHMMSRMLIVSPASKQRSHPILISSVTNTSGRTVIGESTGHSRTGGPVERGVQDQTVQQC